MSREFKGVMTALVTPFFQGEVDYKSFIQLLHHQLKGEIDGLVINGTTAESPNLERVEVQKLFEVAKKEVQGKVPLILGTGSNSTKKTIEMTRFAEELKADAALVVVPYYNKPQQHGLIAHFKSVAESTALPVLLYNVPGRTIVSLSADTVVELSKVPNIIGIKEASGDLSILIELYKRCDRDFLITSGDDSSCIEFMLAGGQGVISVISNLIPKPLVQLSLNARRGQQGAREEYIKYIGLNKLLGVEANPIPVKMGLYLMGIIRSPELRLPLTTLTDTQKKKLQFELKKLGVMK